MDFRSLRPYVKTTARTRGDVSGDSYREGMDNLPSANNRAVDGEERGRRSREEGREEGMEKTENAMSNGNATKKQTRKKNG